MTALRQNRTATKVTAKHFEEALAQVRPSIDQETQKRYEQIFKHMKTAISKKSEEDLGIGYYR